jgi:hypothetical protein
MTQVPSTGTFSNYEYRTAQAGNLAENVDKTLHSLEHTQSTALSFGQSTAKGRRSLWRMDTALLENIAEMKLSTLIGTPKILCVSVYISTYYVDISGPICKKVRLLVQKILFGRISGVLTSAEQRQWSNWPDLCCATAEVKPSWTLLCPDRGFSTGFSCLPGLRVPRKVLG